MSLCPGKELSWFSYRPESDFRWFATEQEAVDWTERDIADWLAENDNQWPDGVEQYIVGCASKVATQTGRKEKPSDAELDEAGCDSEGYNWSKVPHFCNYKMMPLVSAT